MRSPALATPVLAAVLATALVFGVSSASAAGLPCRPCAGLVADGPEGLAEALSAQAGLQPGSPLFIAWEVSLGPVPSQEAADAGEAAARVARAGGTPWLALVFRTPPPLAANAARLQGELEIAAAVARAAPAGAVFQVVWRPEGHEANAPGPAEYAFLLKRAAVALTGARPDGRVATAALPATAAAVADLYAQDVGAYVDVLTFAPGAPEAVAAAAAAAAKADPGRPVALDGAPLPEEPALVLAEAARWAVAGIDLTLFRQPAPPPTLPIPALLAPFALLAREFGGDVSYDPDSSPTGAESAWSFVRGKDLALRVIAVVPAGAESGALTLHFADGTLRRPVRFPLGRGRVELPAGRTTASGLDLTLAAPGRVAVVGLERPSAAERQGVAEKVTVSSQREMPVEEVLRRLQAFEDAQDRRLDHYRALDTTHLRFQVSGLSQAFDVALEGPFFSRRGEGTDWAWQNLFVNGVRWKGKSIPEIPLVQPEKAAAMPLEIHFNKEYRYRLRGTEKIGGRDAWVVDFAPAAADLARERLHQGTVWIDRQIYSRLRTRAVQLGLSGEILSNEETWTYSPVDDQGRPASWPAPAAGTAAAFVLPLHLVGQQILSIVGTTTVVERETVLAKLEINDSGFAAARRAVAASDVTMVRDTDKGLRYLVKDKSGDRVVQEGFAKSKLFAVGGVFYDDALNYPLPLAGVNYFTLDYKGTGKQVNIFFAGALLTASAAQPNLFGSRLDASSSLFALALPVTDTFFDQRREIHEDEVKVLPASFGFKLGRPLGNFWKVDVNYGLLYNRFSRTDNTAKDFVLPSDNFLQSFELGAAFARAGYRFNADASYNARSRWELWGLPGSADFTPEAQRFYRWDAALSKNWYLPYFQKIGAEVDYDSGSRLDRFSKYQFGFFGNTRVHGYQTDRVRATTAYSGHLTYGFEIGQLLRLDAVGDVALATDRATGLDRRLLAGTGLVGTFMGPWETVVNMDLGVPVAGPDHGFVLYLAFLKLFK